ncbi:MAG: hypothetical protein ACREQ7_11175 [Candidatus Binatia bacterium]
MEIGKPGGIMDANDRLDRGPVELIVNPELSKNKEAEIMESGLHLGPIGGRIVGEAIIGLLQLDRVGA